MFQQAAQHFSHFVANFEQVLLPLSRWPHLSYFYYLYRQKRNENKRLAKKVEEQTANLLNEKIELEKSNIIILKQNKQKDSLVQEVHHRVKNNLQVISSILNLQSSFVTDENTLGILQESRNRIRSMAIIHENLYRTEDFSSIKFDSYIKNLTHNLIASYSVNRKVVLEIDLAEIDLVLDQAIPCGLLINELITKVFVEQLRLHRVC